MQHSTKFEKYLQTLKHIQSGIHLSNQLKVKCSWAKKLAPELNRQTQKE